MICRFASLVKRIYGLFKPESGSNEIARYQGTTGLVLSEEQYSIFKFIENTNEHVFVTGKAGTGKSMLLKYFAQHTNKCIVKVAPTGIAALNIHGQTIHSLFRLPIGVIDGRKLRIDAFTKQTLEHIDTVVIDEISMVRADVMDSIDHILRLAKNTSAPFGGVQIIAFGDIYQLPPVVESETIKSFLTNRYGGIYFFNAPAMRTSLHVRELQAVFRQKHPEFKAVLNVIREGSRDSWIFTELSKRTFPVDYCLPKNTILLTATNKAARALNATQLSKLNTKSHTYTAIMTGNFPSSSQPTDTELTLKVGAQVIFTKNDQQRRWVNGTTGIVKSLSKNTVKISCGKQTFNVEPVSWDITGYTYNQELGEIEQELTGTFTQIPLRTAWAMTIHKSQGCTFDKVAIDLGTGAFAHGQTYVALSRCSSLSGLYVLQALRPQDIIIDPLVHAYMKQKTLT